MKVVVLGSGIIGVSTAWWLRQAGHDVVVIDRETSAGLETSFANGAQISVSYAEPWANPQAPLKLLKWLNKKDAPLLFRPQFDWRQWVWGLGFLRECLPSRLNRNIEAMVRLAQYSHETLKEMRQTLDISYDHLENGILNFYQDKAEFDASQKAADVMRDFGVDRRVVTADEVIEIEPALAPHRAVIVGGDYTASDESGDAYLFTKGLAELAQAQGVEFLYSTRITQVIRGENGLARGVEVVRSDGCYDEVHGDAVVVSLGSFTPQLMRPLGIHCLMYPTKGYSATFPILDPDRAPVVSLTDSSHKVVYTRLGDNIRMAGTAELSGYSRTLNPVRCQAMTDQARALFDGVLDFDRVQFWTGLRPSTPSNVPLIGKTRIPNLYINSGHGTLGWTMGVGSGRAMADIVSGLKPEPIFPFMGI
ncbi:D-amino acid dehydrogenase [Orrella sp. 11846]|uniref:D-amino acid dehydrogenase n=1 Tax=Orrella sp. 11846 TaxID=3409913 RepID=UPI003B5CBFEE